MDADIISFNQIIEQHKQFFFTLLLFHIIKYVNYFSI